MPYPCWGPRVSSVLRIINARVPCHTSDVLRIPSFRLRAAPSVVHDPAVAQVDHARAIRGVGLRMRHLHDGRPAGVERPKEFHDLLTLPRMEVPGRLVGEQDLWTRD